MFKKLIYLKIFNLPLQKTKWYFVIMHLSEEKKKINLKEKVFFAMPINLTFQRIKFDNEVNMQDTDYSA